MRRMVNLRPLLVFAFRLANATLSFIEGAEAVSVIRTGGTSAAKGGSKAATRVATTPPGKSLSSAEDAARRKSSGEQEQPWFVSFTNAQGKMVISRMSTAQIEQAIRAGTLDLKTKAKRTANDEFLPLAQFPQFTDLMTGRAVKAKADAKSQNLKEFYGQIDRQERNRQRFRWFKRIGEGVFGSFTLIIWLAVIAAALYGLYLGVPYAMRFIAEKLGVS